MIELNSDVRLIGKVSGLGTGSYTISVLEVFVDGEWRAFKEPKTFEVNTASDYSDASLTEQELAFVKHLADLRVDDTTLEQDDLMIVKSITKKLAELKK